MIVLANKIKIVDTNCMFNMFNRINMVFMVCSISVPMFYTLSEVSPFSNLIERFNRRRIYAN